MNRLQLATLLSWAGNGGLQGRKRLQKVVFFLQGAGCPLNCRFTLHYFGPYSRDVADACDEMVTAGLIDEQVEPQNGVAQYTYTLPRRILDMVATEADADLKSFENLGRELIDPCKTHIWWLELGSTILFFYNSLKDWDDAFFKGCEFKKVKVSDSASKLALDLARRVYGQSGN